MVTIQQALILADISRLLGNPKWRDVFGDLAEEVSPEMLFTIRDLQRVCNEAMLDAFWKTRRKHWRKRHKLSKH